MDYRFGPLELEKDKERQHRPESVANARIDLSHQSVTIANAYHDNIAISIKQGGGAWMMEYVLDSA